MPDEQPCPLCVACQSSDVKWLEGPSTDAWVDYCRCNTCGHVWGVPKPGHGGGGPFDVTERTK